MNKVIKILRLITVLAGITVLFGCSTKLTVTSEPDGAVMSFKGREKTTPFVISYGNIWLRELPYTIYKKNYKSQIGVLPSSNEHVHIVLSPLKGR
ncbi:MAG: hypothetical protein L3J59_13550 [Methylococcaceae bacterium]|nr:hypothetical protein [Methylococcaceae bacterium]